MTKRGNCFAPFHWNDEFGANLALNAATSDAVDAVSLQPEFKFCAVALTKAPAELEADFTPHQKIYLRQFLADQPASTTNRFRLPAAAPFTQNQRVYINEALAKMLTGG
jgi:hypothetical protein